MVENGLVLVDHQLTVALPQFVVMLSLHQLVSVCILTEILHFLMMMVGTSVVYPLIVQILTLTSSLLMYSVSVLIVLVHTVIYCIGWAQIEDITVDLPPDITVLPQNFTLLAIKIGYRFQSYLNAANWYYESDSTSTELCSGYRYLYNCSIGNGMAVDKGNGRYDYTLTVTWNGENITSEVLSQSNNGDHVYRFYLSFGDVERNRTLTVSGRL